MEIKEIINDAKIEAVKYIHNLLINNKELSTQDLFNISQALNSLGYADINEMYNNLAKLIFDDKRNDKDNESKITDVVS